MNYCHFDEKKQLHKRSYEIIYIVKENGCHECYSHRKDRDGYPRIDRLGKEWIMSRYIWTLMHGDILDKLVVRHKCDSPSCINIDHLELGTQKQNLVEMWARGRGNKNKKQLSKKDKMAIINSKKTIKQLALDYSVSHSTIVKTRKRCTMRKKINRVPNKPFVMGATHKLKSLEIKQVINK